METKKSPKANLQNKRKLFLEIGLIFSLGTMIAAFGYSSQGSSVPTRFGDAAPAPEEELTEITYHEKTPTPVKHIIQVSPEYLRIVPDNQKIEIEYVIDEFSPDDIYVPEVAVGREATVEEDEVFLVAEYMPEFMGGDLNRFRSWVSERLHYPTVAAENGIEGTVLLTFVVEKDGTLAHIEVLQSPDRSLAEEAVRVLQTSPKWKPGMQRTTPVRVRFTLPLQFRLQH